MIPLILDFQTVKARLEGLGIAIEDLEESLIELLISNAESYAKIEINQLEIPEELVSILVDMVSGEYIKLKRSMNALPGFDISGAVRSVSEGEVSVTFASGATDVERLDFLISSLIGAGVNQWSAFRKMRW